MNTPEILRKKYGLPEKCSKRTVSRVHLAFRGRGPAINESGPVKANRDKFAYLATVIPMIVAGALPQDGQYRRYTERYSQKELSGRAGLACRETFTRRTSLFCPEAPSPRRKRAANPMHVLHRERGFTEPNRYWFANLGERLKEYQIVESSSGRILKRSSKQKRIQQRCDELNTKAGGLTYQVQERELPSDRYHAPTQEQLCADPNVGSFWDSGANFGDGFKDVPSWIFDKRLPLSDTARLVFVYYVFCGLLDHDPATDQVRGEVHPRQSKVAAALGITIRSVYAANQELVNVGLIRVAHPKPTVQGGKFVRGPARIIYLPIRQMTSEEAAAERDRFHQVVSRIRDQVAASRAAMLHNSLLTAWTGQEHHLRSFWNELRRQLLADGIDRSIVRTLIPRPPS